MIIIPDIPATLKLNRESSWNRWKACIDHGRCVECYTPHERKFDNGNQRPYCEKCQPIMDKRNSEIKEWIERIRHKQKEMAQLDLGAYI